MKKTIFTILYISMIMGSCSSDGDEASTPDIIGTYTILSARDECSNPSDNQMADNAGSGICIGQTCTQITQVFFADNTYTYLQRDEINTGAIISSMRTEEEGSYEISGTTLTTTSTDGIITTQTIVDNGFFIDWLAVTTDIGCDRIFRFSR